MTARTLSAASLTVALAFSVHPAPAAATTLNAIADSYIRQGDQNEGGVTFLRLRNTNNHRALVRFDQNAIAQAAAGGVLQTATLEMFIESSNSNWGTGRPIDVHRLAQEWSELGVTYNCPNDTNTSNSSPDCAAQWGGGNFAAAATADYLQTSTQTGPIQLDVTADVAAFLAGTPNFGWLLKKRAESENGLVEYTSREGTAGRGPKLVLDIFVPPTNTPTATPTATPTSTPTATPTATFTPDPRCGALPIAGCRQSVEANKSSLKLRDKGGEKDQLTFKWAKGEETDIGDFGDPSSATTYAVCLYDETAGTPSLVFEALVPPGGSCGGKACWKETRKGFRYADKQAVRDGIKRLDLKSGPAGTPGILVVGRGSNLVLPTLPLRQDQRVFAQVKNDHQSGECWEARFSGPARNSDAGKFKDKGDAPVTAAPVATPTPTVAASSTPGTGTATPTTTATTTGDTPTPAPTATPGDSNCGNGFLEPGEFYDHPVNGPVGDLAGSECPQDTQVLSCTAAGLVTFAADLVPPPGAQPTSATILIGYRSDLMRLPAAAGTSTITRVTWPNPQPFVRGATDFDYAVRVVTVRSGPFDTDAPIFSVQFDTCAGQPQPDPALDLGCIVEGCASAGGPVANCVCSVH